MSDPSQRRPWSEGPDEEAEPESWLVLDDDGLLHRIETLGAEEDEDDQLLAVVGGERHFFIRQEAAKRVKDRRRLYSFEDDRHVGQILVRHLSRREDLTYLERISMLSRHVEVRQAAQVQLARVWRRVERSQPRETRPMTEASLAATPEHAAPPAAAPVISARPAATAGSADVPLTSAPLEGEEVDASLLGWAAHFLVEQAWNHLGTNETRALLLQSHHDLAPACPTLALFTVGEDARVTLEFESGPRIPRLAVRDLAVWMAAFRRAARRTALQAGAVSVRACTALMADALRAAGFYAASDEAEAALGD